MPFKTAHVLALQPIAAPGPGWLNVNNTQHDKSLCRQVYKVWPRISDAESRPQEGALAQKVLKNGRAEVPCVQGQ